VAAGRIEIIEAAHPVPDDRSLEAGRRIVQAVQGLTQDDLVIAMISGGSSSLMVLPAGAMTLAEKQDINEQHLKSGATIRDMNAVRKHLSRLKGGQLALAARPARLVSLVISDVPGDDPSDVASGPTVADDSTIEMVRQIIARRHIRLPKSAEVVLDERKDTPKQDEIAAEVRIVAAPSLALAAAARIARAAGVNTLILGDALEGEAREMGIVMSGIARSARKHGFPVNGPTVLLSGGETTVTLGRRAGRGGHNTEFLLSLGVALKGHDGIWGFSGDTDGIDGTEDAAGAFVAPDTLQRSWDLGLDPQAYLANHDSYSFFNRLDNLVRTGPTLTNVNDFRAIFVS